MKTLLITGGLGFIGSHFIQMLFTNEKYKDIIKIINVDKDLLNRKKHNHLSHLKQIKNQKQYLYREVDICDSVKMQALIYLHRPDKIVHFAAETHVDCSIQTPELHTHTNILGTVSMLIAASKYYNILLNDEQKKNFRFHHISTDEVYGDIPIQATYKFNQNSRYNPSSPYSATKAGSDHLVKAWHRTYGLPISISNCSNNYGRYQDDTKLIPRVVKLCLNQQPITIHGTGQYIRDWILAEDHCRGILDILQNLQLTNNQQYLFGGECQRSNIYIIDLICQILDKIYPRKNRQSYKQLKVFIENRKGQDLKYAIDNTKVNTQLDWNISTQIEQNLQQIIKYYIKD